jgi:hypothetical protein
VLCEGDGVKGRGEGRLCCGVKGWGEGGLCCVMGMG